jgi:hypothetical protein
MIKYTHGFVVIIYSMFLNSSMCGTKTPTGGGKLALKRSGVYFVIL